MANPTSDPQQNPDTGSGPAGDREAARIRSLDERFSAIESEQASQRGLLQEIRDAITGGHADPGDGQADPGETEAAGPPNIGAEVRRQIAEADQRRAAEEERKEGQTWRQTVEERLEALKPEQAPREAQTGRKGTLQRIMFGRPD